jgi:L-threonylcarbamoyladenylate synthase
MIPVFSLPDPSSWSDAKEILEKGGILALPTEFSYALSEAPEWVDPDLFSWERNRRIYRLKERNPRKPVLYLAGSIEIVERFAYLPSNAIGRRLASRWPGFLTLVLKARPLATQLGMASRDGVSFRIPHQSLLRRFLKFLGTPLSGTSLNISGNETITGAYEAASSFPTLDAVIDGGFKPGKPVSPVVDVRYGTPIVVRDGSSIWFPWASLR